MGWPLGVRWVKVLAVLDVDAAIAKKKAES
jgi:hypothetical protein